MSIAKKLIRELKTIPFSAECVTKEKLVLDIYDQERAIENCRAEFAAQKVYTPMTVMVTELSEFLGAGSVGMINFLTTIYDQDIYEHRTKNKGDVFLTGPFLNLLACTTPDWITTYLRSDVISGGFSRRAIFVLETGKSGRIAFPEVTPAATRAWDRTIAYARRLQQIHGPMVWDPQARSFYEHWYKNLEMPTEETVIGYYETKHMQLLKIAMLMSVSEGTDLVLRQEHLEGGLALLQLAEENLAKVFAGIGRNELNAAATKVLDIFLRLPITKVTIDGTPRSTALILERKLFGMMFSVANEQEMHQVLQHLVNTEKLGRIQIRQGEAIKTFVYLRNWK
jgi:hypothetical protein